MNFGAYEDRLRPDMIAPVPACVKEAKRRLDTYLNEAEDRKVILGRLLSENGVSLGNGNEEIEKLTAFLVDAARSDNDPDAEFSVRFLSVLWDVGQYIGNACLARSPSRNLKWDVEDRSFKWEQPRFVIVISGYAGESETFEPDRLLLDIAREARKGTDVPLSVVWLHLDRVVRLSLNWMD